MNNKTKNMLRKFLYPYLCYREKRIQQKRKELRDTPKALAAYLYKQHFFRKLDWNNPTELNEKIRWIQFNTDITIWTRLADKYIARFYVEEKGYSNILVKLYGVWNKADDIDFKTLPNSFVLKTNHGCGEVIIISDKRKIDLEEVRDKIDKYLAEPFGYKYAETQYLSIPRKIIAEELLDNTSEFSASTVDYKFYCLNGEPYVCGVFYNRDLKTHTTWSAFYDMKWIRHPEWRKSSIGGGQNDVPQPRSFNKMKQICRDLCKGMPFCRLDFYESNGKPYFGEFTFTPANCSGGSMAKELCVELGKKLILPQVTRPIK